VAAFFVSAGDQERHTKGSAHDGLLTLGSFTEAQGQVADRLGNALHLHGLVVGELVAQGLASGVVN